MIKLSRQAWNNVLIVTMIVMIFLFNSTNNILTGGQDDDPKVLPILPEGSLILTVEMGDRKIERIGRSWRANPSLDMADEALSALMSNWQNGLVMVDEGALPDTPIVIVVWLAGETKGRVFQLFEQQGSTFLFFDNKRYRILDLTLPQLIPGEFINA